MKTYKLKDLIEAGFIPTKQEDILELTVEEVSKKYGKAVKIVEGIK